ncbi:MAG: hypothetical protein ACI35W_05095 [Anaeroplasmataceae bacterium]
MYNYYIPSNRYMYRYDNTINNENERGILLPFLAGVLVTTPFVFLAKNQNQQMPYYPPQAPVYYPMYQNPYPYMPYRKIY